MGAFKEPQPRKKSVEKDAEKVIGGQWPPYQRLGDEARWDARNEKANADLAEARVWEPEQAPIMVVPDYSPFELRKAALEAACALYVGRNDFDSFWPNIETFEDYLRDGTKP